MTNKKIMQKNQLNEKKVAAYLEEHPDFFINKDQLLSSLHLPHSKKGVISLVEKQMTLLREENKQQKNILEEFIVTATENEARTNKIQSLAIELISSEDLKSTLQICHDSLTNDFQIDTCKFILFTEMNIQKCNYIDCLKKNDSSLKSFQAFLKSKSPRCNKLTDSQYKFLFTRSKNIASSALIPLNTKKTYGFLAIGSHDIDRFNPSMSTDFLSLIGTLISRSIERDITQ